MIELIQLTDIGTRKDVHIHPDEIRTVEPLDPLQNEGARSRVQLSDGSIRNVSQGVLIILNRRRAALSQPETKGNS